MSIRGNSNKEARGVMKSMVELTTAFVGPKVPNRPKSPTPEDSISGSSSQAQTLDEVSPHHSTDMLEHMHKIYERLKGDDELLSKAKLADFLQRIQGETNVKLDREYYSSGDFVYTWTMHYSPDALGPRSKKDLSKTLDQLLHQQQP